MKSFALALALAASAGATAYAQSPASASSEVSNPAVLLQTGSQQYPVFSGLRRTSVRAGGVIPENGSNLIVQSANSLPSARGEASPTALAAASTAGRDIPG